MDSLFKILDPTILLPFIPVYPSKQDKALLTAAEEGDLNEVLKLLSEGANINAQAKNRYTPLHLACKRGRVAVVKALLEKGAHVAAIGADRKTPLHLACASGGFEVVEALLAKGPDINQKDICGEIPLHRVSSSRSAKALLAKGANINERDIKGRTPLHLSCRNGKVKVVEVLLANGANTDAETYLTFRTPVDYAYKAILSEDIIKLLLSPSQTTESDAQITPSGQVIHVMAEGNQDLLKAANTGDMYEAVRLLDKGASISSRNEFGETQLHYACHCAHVEVVKELLSKGANINAQSENKETPLHHCCYSGSVELAELLLARGADCGVSNDIGETPLHVACHYGHIEVVMALLAKGADIEATSNKGWVSMHYACESGVVEVVKALLSKGAHINNMDIDGNTPLDVAKSSGRDSVIKLLTSYVDGNGFSCYTNVAGQNLQTTKSESPAADMILTSATRPSDHKWFVNEFFSKAINVIRRISSLQMMTF